MHVRPEYRELLKGAMARFDSSFFAYDLDGLTQHLANMRQSVGPDVKLWYACKANPLSAILKEFRAHNFGIDVASQGELEQALNAGHHPSDIISTGPSKSRKFLRQLLQYGVDTIVLESLNQAYWLSEIAGEMKLKPKVLLRVQLSWDEGESVLGGDEITAFGLGPKTWRELDLQKCQHLDIQGFHCFQWGNLLESSRLKDIWWKISQTLKDLAGDLNVPFRILDLGGGLGLPYGAGENPLNFDDISSSLDEIQQNFGAEKIWMELGRYAVGEFGLYLTQVIDRKHVRGREILVTDGGINHIARPALTGQSFPCELFRDSREKKSTFYVHGPLCTALDKLGHFELPADTEPGDWLMFHQTGAYGFTEAMPFFLCHNLPAETLLKNGRLEVIRTVRSASNWLV